MNAPPSTESPHVDDAKNELSDNVCLTVKAISSTSALLPPCQSRLEGSRPIPWDHVRRRGCKKPTQYSPTSVLGRRAKDITVARGYPYEGAGPRRCNAVESGE